jgi:hypothetical protein
MLNKDSSNHSAAFIQEQLYTCCCRLLLTKRHSACHVQRLTAQHIYCTNCTVWNWTVLTVITQKLPLHVQLHNSTETVQLMSSEVECSRLFDITSTYTDIHVQKLDPSKNSVDSKRTPTNSERNAKQSYVATTAKRLSCQLIWPDAMT